MVYQKTESEIRTKTDSSMTTMDSFVSASCWYKLPSFSE